MAIAARVATAIAKLTRRCFMTRYPSYLWRSRYQGFEPNSGPIACPPWGSRAPVNTKTDQTGVGRLHYSLRLTLSAQFR
jgi:hypothetical protein